ncbi:MAG: D-alanyl-D-alanine carboxypeptidase [Ruminococcaceae bacterium]|nr:D-alanyl-D-alanine carboxypeptidase [Oscillospiraceae bacterium]
MSKIKKSILFLLCLCLLLPSLCPTTHATDATSSLSVSAQSAILIEAESGKVIYEKEANRALPMASTTKIMTALVALEEMSPDTLVTVDGAAVGTEGSSVYLIEGEQLTLAQLLYALLLESANDAAVAIAIAVAGSVEEFAALMNERAKALGLTDTHFTNPHGLDHEEHYTTAHELAIIAREALSNELFCTIVSTRKTTIPHAGEEGVRLLVNHNKLLRLYEGCIGVKTGYTQRSGRCLVSAAERDGVRLIAVTINASSDWDDHTRMLDHGFSLFRSVTLCKSDELLYPLPVVGGTDAYVMLGNRETVTATLPKSATEIETRIECRRFEYAQISEGETYGKAVFLSDTDGDGRKETVGECPLTALYTVSKKAHKNKFWAWLTGLFSN